MSRIEATDVAVIRFNSTADSLEVYDTCRSRVVPASNVRDKCKGNVSSSRVSYTLGFFGLDNGNR